MARQRGSSYAYLTSIRDTALQLGLKSILDRLGKIEGMLPAIGTVSATLTQALNAGRQRLINVADPIRDQDVVTLKYLKQYVQAALANSDLSTSNPNVPPGGGGGGDHPAIPDHGDLVNAMWSANPPATTVEGAFKFAQSIAWALKDESIDGAAFNAGLLIKTGGENIFTCSGESYSASRVCYPDGHIFKVLTDVPATNGPTWADDGFVTTDRYHVATDPGDPC